MMEAMHDAQDAHDAPIDAPMDGPIELEVEGAEPRLDVDALLRDVTALRHEVADRGRALAERWSAADVRPAFAPSLGNLAAYLALRTHDLRALQRNLAALGLSSLGRIEGRVVPSLDAVLGALGALAGRGAPTPADPGTFYLGERLLRAEKRRVFGASPDPRRVRIMVTLPDDADDPNVVRPLLDAGMNVARINAARGEPDGWAAMVNAVRWAAVESGRPCSVLVDLPGSKLRIRKATWHDDADARLHRGEAFALGTSAAVEGARLSLRLQREAALAQLRVGQEVFVDDGKIGGEVERLAADAVVVRVTRARPRGEKVAVGRGVNLPGVALGPQHLGDADLAALAFAREQADILGLSFLDTADDVREVQAALDAMAPGAPLPPAVVKVETRQAVAHLPEMIVAAASRQPLAVMIARGDLAVEIGYRRLAEMQEEILWLCEAARVPVVWATQVLETLAKKGVPTRAELTDAAMAERAECVLLNKGPYVVEAVRLLDDVLRRMESHQSKKTSRLRRLGAWRHLV